LDPTRDAPTALAHPRESARIAFLIRVKTFFVDPNASLGPRKKFNVDKKDDKDGLTRIYPDQALICRNIDRPEMTLAFRIG